METAKIRIKIGDNEFEAEGGKESIQLQYDAFLKAISSVAPIAPKSVTPSETQIIDNNNNVSTNAASFLEKIMHVAGRVVSLTAIPASTQDAALLIMLGHKDLRDNPSVTGQEIGDGLAQSGRPIDRTDRIMVQPLAEALVLKTGIKRSTRYRLTNSGNQRALTIARDLIASLP